MCNLFVFMCLCNYVYLCVTNKRHSNFYFRTCGHLKNKVLEVEITFSCGECITFLNT